MFLQFLTFNIFVYYLNIVKLTCQKRSNLSVSQSATSKVHFIFFSNNQIGKRGKRFIPIIKTVINPEWSGRSTDQGGPNEEPALVIESPEKDILTIAQGETLFQIDSDNRIRLARLIELPEIDFSKIQCFNPSSKMIIRRQKYKTIGFSICSHRIKYIIF